MKMTKLSLVFLALAFFIACSGEASKPTANTSSTTDNSAGTTSTTKKADASVNASKLGDPKSSIEYQFELVKAGNYEKLKDCLTDRVKGNLTKETVENAKGNAAKYSMEDLYGSVEDGEMNGKKTKKVKMKSGRTLTTLVETDGKWLADTIWFN